MKRIGFACKWSEYDAKGEVVSTDDLNARTTTLTWLRRQSQDIAEQKLWELMIHNIDAIKRLVKRVGGLDESLRMVRLGSELLPLYTEPNYSYFYGRTDVRDYAAKHFAEVGQLARHYNVRLSFHPGQFCVLASDNPGIVDRSIEEFEYHADMARWMGYGQTFQDLKINIHVSGKQGVAGMRRALQRLSPEARNTITLENEEITYGLDDCLELSDMAPVVLDIHHHWCKTGEYISALDPRVDRVIQSWRGVRPTMHYSVSREDCVVDHCNATRPDLTALLDSGYKKGKLRAHSDFYWNTAVNDWALTFIDSFDIMCESKAKNLASFKLYEHAKETGVL